MKINSVLLSTSAAVCMALALAACGSGSDSPTATTPTTPTQPTPPTLATAAASVSGLLDYMKLAVASLLDTAEPADVSAFVPPTSDTTEPDPAV